MIVTSVFSRIGHLHVSKLPSCKKFKKINPQCHSISTAFKHVDVKSYLWVHVSDRCALLRFCLVLCEACRAADVTSRDVGTEGWDVYSTCIYDRPIMQQPQHVLSVLLFCYFQVSLVHLQGSRRLRASKPLIWDKMSSCGWKCSSYKLWILSFVLYAIVSWVTCNSQWVLPHQCCILH